MLFGSLWDLPPFRATKKLSSPSRFCRWVVVGSHKAQLHPFHGLKAEEFFSGFHYEQETGKRILCIVKPLSGYLS